MKRKQTLALLLALLAFALSGCGDSAGTADPDTTIPETTTPVTEVQPATAVLTNAGKASYQMIRAEETNDQMLSLFQQIAKTLENDFGIRYTLGTDWIKRNTVPDSSLPEILFGATNRPETAEVAARVGCGGYAVEIVGKKIVVYGSSYEAQRKASQAFADALTKNEAGELVLTLPAGGIFEAGEASFFAGGDASDYVIVADKANQAIATELQTAIRKAFGYELPINDRIMVESPREIIIGSSGRASIDAIIGAIDSPIGYAVKTEGEKVLLVGKSSFAIRQAVEHFIQNYVTDAFSAVLHLPHTVDYSYAGLNGARYVELTKDADVRIMSFNVLNENWGDKLPLAGRSEIVASLLLTYLPDVIGWQEVSDGWYARLKQMVTEQYAFVNEKTAAGLTNYSGMAYNKEKVKLITTGCELFSKGNSGNMRLMNWAIFETIAGGERFAVINTHLDINRTDGTPANSYRLVQAKEMGEKVLVLQKEYNCPVFITGDYNCNRNTEEYRLFVGTAKVKDAQWDAATCINNTFKTYHTPGQIAGAGDTSIDHITYTEGAEALFYMNHIAPPICDASDHNPIMADFKLN